MFRKRKLVALLVILLSVFIFASLTLASGLINVVNPETARVPALVPPQLAPPPQGATYVDQPAGAVISAPDGRPVAQFSSPPTNLAGEVAVNIAPLRATPDPAMVSFQVLASVRYRGDGHTVLVTTARPSVAAAQTPVALGEHTVKLPNGTTGWSAMRIPGDTPNQVVFLHDDLIITVAGDLPIESLQELAVQVVIR